MAQLIIDIPDAHVQRVLDRLTERYGGPVNGTNGQKAAFLKGWIADQLRRSVLTQERYNAGDAVNNPEPDIS